MSNVHRHRRTVARVRANAQPAVSAALAHDMPDATLSRGGRAGASAPCDVPPMRRSRLLAALTLIADEDDLDGYNAADYLPGPHRDIEPLAHELAHALVLGGRMSSDDVGTRLHAMDDDAADASETMTLRIEVESLCRLGFRVARHRLRVCANYNGDTPPAAAFDAPLTLDEQALVDQFVQIVAEADRRAAQA